MKLVEGHWYKFNDRGEIHIGYFCGSQLGFECCVCGKGNRAYTFNIWHRFGTNMDYEMLKYGKEHLPELLEDLGTRNGIIIDLGGKCK